MSVTLGGNLLEQAMPSTYNVVILCQDLQLDWGWLPISVQWASTSVSMQSILHLWVVRLSAKPFPAHVSSMN